MSSVRDRVDRCPGALSVHPAADGGLARVRLPGGAVSADALRVLATAATELGDGHLELTSRGNVQLRALTAGAEIELAERLADVGLLPSLTHERVRNIVASPLSGLDTAGHFDVSELARSLDRQLCARPVLAGLPGRFLFAIDDGRGDVSALEADVTLIAGPDSTMLLEPAGCVLPVADAVATALDVAEEFLRQRAESGSSAWRISELDDRGAALFSSIRRRHGAATRTELAPLPTQPPSPAPARPAGLVAESSLVVLARLGRLNCTQARFIASQAGSGGVRVTPWRSVVLPDLDDAAGVAAEAEAIGLGIGADSPWYWISACTGLPGCASALADVQADAIADVAAARNLPGRVTRWSGCGRRCGRPNDTELDIVATAGGYLRTRADLDAP